MTCWWIWLCFGYTIFFSASQWLKGHNENKVICLFCVILAILFFFSLILILTSTFFIRSYFLKKIGYLIFCFHGKIKLTYLVTLQFQIIFPVLINSFIFCRTPLPPPPLPRSFLFGPPSTHLLIFQILFCSYFRDC